ncbi:hypothetical protein H9L10_03715 [Phycicoccus endophyticus]|uniref:XRE family transcriptional regulator n=1 Tax=Phycicoccus endophyticus TaxID=1690220 RepID=A0A7G9R3K1_9MICO|nr:hypothetical protein [Phycicoccus endophyticus]NHI19933.1 hypothetical protein [Phycicoccus endophyticus]QNN50176.1 hypothetical protein H9L10_03715 [Phycicoccus endophyticus]
MTEKQTRLETLTAEEVLAEAARKGLRHNAIQSDSGVLARAWGHYFVQRDRAIPFGALLAVCEAMGVSASDIIQRAEARLSADPGLPRDAYRLAASRAPRERPFTSQE